MERGRQLDRSSPTTCRRRRWRWPAPGTGTSRGMESESAVSTETPIPLFSAVGASAPLMREGARPTSVERAPHKRLMLFGGRSNPALCERIADHLGVLPGEVTLKTFTNSEVYARYEESIRGADVFLVQSCSPNA